MNPNGISAAVVYAIFLENSLSGKYPDNSPDGTAQPVVVYQDKRRCNPSVGRKTNRLSRKDENWIATSPLFILYWLAWG